MNTSPAVSYWPASVSFLPLPFARQSLDTRSPPTESIISGLARESIFGAHMPAFSPDASAAATSLSIKFFSATISLFRVSMYFPFATFMPLLLPAANPVFSVFSITTASGNFLLYEIHGAVRRAKALSTNITSRPFLFCARTDSRQSFKNLLPLKLTMITDTVAAGTGRKLLYR